MPACTIRSGLSEPNDTVAAEIPLREPRGQLSRLEVLNRHRQYAGCWGWITCIAMLVMASLIDPAVAQPVRQEPTTVERSATTTTGPAGAIAITLRNGGQSMRLRMLPSFRLAAGSDAVAAAWTRLRDGAGPVDSAFALDANETATFEARAQFPRLGAWETAIEAIDPNGELVARFILVITRTAIAVPSDLLLQPRPARITLPFLTTALPEARPVALIARNTTTAAVEIEAARVGSFSTLVEGEELSVAARQPLVNDAACQRTLLPQQDCTITLTIPQGLGPGRYEVDVAVLGPGGGQSRQALVVEVKLSFWWAWIVVVAGAALGTLVDSWRKDGRGVIVARLAVAERLDRIEQVLRATVSPAARRAVRAVQERLGALDARLRSGVSASDLAGFDAQIALLRDAVEADAEVGTLEPPAAELVARAHQRLAAALEAHARNGEPADTLLAETAAALRSDLADLAALTEATKRAQAIHASIGRELRELPSAFATKMVELVATLNVAWNPPSAAETQGVPAARLASLEQGLKVVEQASELLPSELKALAEAALASAPSGEEEPAARARTAAEGLEARWPDLALPGRIAAANAFAATHGGAIAPPRPAATPARTALAVPTLPLTDTGLTLQVSNLFLGPSRAATLSELAAYRARWEWTTNLVVLAGVGLVGVLTLWAPAPGWGSTTDIIVALLAGAATRLTIGAVAKPN